MLAFAACALLALGFGVNAAAKWIYWNDPAHQNQSVAGWMTPRYVSHSWKLPPGYLRSVILPDSIEAPKGKTLAEIAVDQGRSLNELIDQINAAIASHSRRRDD